MKKIISKLKILLQIIILFFFISSCKINQTIIIQDDLLHTTTIENGDLIFVSAENDNLSEAINRVTQTSQNINFDHVGLIEKTKYKTYVLHAAPKKGSNKENILHFYKRSKEPLIIYRLKDEYKKSIPNAITEANNMLGKPYNWEYILNEDSYYCSDFIERVFRKDAIFEFIPMNFKDPKTGEIYHYWAEFYEHLNLDVPQDAPGTNPNQLAQSNKLEKIGTLNIIKTK